MDVQTCVATDMNTYSVGISIGGSRWISFEVFRKGDMVVVTGINGKNDQWRATYTFDELERRLKP